MRDRSKPTFDSLFKPVPRITITDINKNEATSNSSSQTTFAMKFNRSLAAAVLASLATSVAADCKMTNTDFDHTLETNQAICSNWGNGYWTLTMIVSDRDFPTFNAGDPWAGYTSSSAFALYDNSCEYRGSYNPHQDGNCGINYIIQEDFLTQTLTIDSVYFDPASPRFSFSYGGTEYSTNSNDCVCTGQLDGLVSTAYCRCGFPNV